MSNDTELLHASVIKRIWKKCKEEDMDIVAFAWRIQREAERAALAAQPGAVGEPMVVLHDDGYWKPCDTPAGRALNTRLMHAGSREVIHAAAPTEAKPAQDAVDARPLTTRELAEVTAPWANVWTDASFGIANAAIAKFCEVNGIQRRPT